MKLWELTIDRGGIAIIDRRLVTEKEMRDLCYALADGMTFEVAFHLDPDESEHEGVMGERVEYKLVSDG
ncbi:hypothetical protein [Agrobacterium sp. CG674]